MFVLAFEPPRIFLVCTSRCVHLPGLLPCEVYLPFCVDAAAIPQDEQSALEIHVYTGDTGTLYVHHDITLPALPLCLAWMDIPPRTPAMLVASGSADEGHTLG